MSDNEVSNLGHAIASVTKQAEALVREEIELAKAEISEKVSGIIRGAVVGIAAGIFVVFALIYLLNAAAWGIWYATGVNGQFWIGFAAVGIILILLAVLAGLLAYKAVKKSVPPIPTLAIAEAQKIKASMSTVKDAVTDPNLKKESTSVE